jgi:hypothetical protein
MVTYGASAVSSMETATNLHQQTVDQGINLG